MARRRADVRWSDSTATSASVRRSTAGSPPARAPLVVLVNNDVECDDDFVERLVGRLEACPGARARRGLLLAPGRATVDSSASRSTARWPASAASPERPTPRPPGRAPPGRGRVAAPRPTGGGALDAVGGSTRRCSRYLEDVDLALRPAPPAGDARRARRGRRCIWGRELRAAVGWQVETAGASRAYLMRKYGVLRSGVGVAALALAAESGATVADAVLERRWPPRAADCAAGGGAAGPRRLRRGRASTTRSDARVAGTPPRGDRTMMHVGLNLVFMVPGETGGMEVAARASDPRAAGGGARCPFTAFVNREARRKTSASSAPWCP